ncbi:zinc finger protein VAR3, chloroplastic [Iris pallida]|uniref:Zinc finger protein VAR3, chloroplastic n=1 Tax=Iris pallida TaxID=29817 RepID=A0AAX6ELB8_IRIPA|nr:zinc finger protein VAR3, chloroplastic [Iris pallida]
MGGSSKILMLLSTPLPLLPSSATALRLSLHCSRLPFRRLSSSHLFQPRLLATRAQLHNQTNAKEPSSSVHSSSPVSVSRAPPEPHPWPEWSALLDHVASAGYSNRPLHDADLDFAAAEGASEEFSRAAEACLAFARDRPDLIRSLSRNNIEAVVEHGSAFLFKNGENSERLMRSFLSGEGSNVFESEKAQTVDVMRYVLSYAYNSLSTSKNRRNGKELVEASARSLLAELINVSVLHSKLKDSVSTPTPTKHEQFTTPPGQNIEMKRGDWICPKCTFMNFAKNMRCLECDEVRPKRQLTGAEWECPQCDFFNYGKNVSCLRCDCKRPGESPSSTVDRILSGSNIDKSELERKLSANDEKAERWLSKVSQLGDSSDISNAVADEDFLRKGANKFVVSNRKTPLERRLDNSQSEIASGVGSDKPSESSISKSLDRILGRTSTPSAGDGNAGATSRFNSSGYRESIAKGDPNYVPFVPLPPDMFRKPQNSSDETEQKEESAPTGGLSDSMPMSTESSTDGKKEGELSDASERVFNKASELDNITDLGNATPDDDFPEIMPMRKGENRFVVSKKKDRSLASPQYKRRLAMEQTNSSNFVPFVPFPPDYFAKKDKQPEGTPVPDKEATAETSAPTEKVQVVSEIVKENKVGSANWGSTSNTSQQPESRTYNEDYNIQSSGSGFSSSASADGVSAQQQAENPQNSKESSDRGFSGKSLEGSAVKEPDPLDMSEEAKAERWFRRVAQIKDISELSQIPDEDFPEIMPMRKGVNRFVVSKRKTPLERRLTSPQYRRNLPIVSSDPEKDASSS